jgi:hypothetical protein
MNVLFDFQWSIVATMNMPLSCIDFYMDALPAVYMSCGHFRPPDSLDRSLYLEHVQFIRFTDNAIVTHKLLSTVDE